MNLPICIHCGSDQVRVNQDVRVQFTTYARHEEEFDAYRTPCAGCDDDCIECVSEEDRKVFMADDDGSRASVPRHGDHVLGDTHPVHDYEYGPDEMDIIEQETETMSIEFTTTCCHVTRSHVRELIRLEDGPALFDDGSESQYSGSKEAKGIIVVDDFNGGLNAEPRSEMDQVLADLADLP